MTKGKVERELILLSVSPKFARLLRDLAKILYPDNPKGSLSRTAEDAIRILANQEKYEQAIQKLRETQNEIVGIMEEVKESDSSTT
jgi:hypothetical protein